MMSPNDAVPAASSARPGALGSLEISLIAASLAPTATSTTRASRASARANLTATPPVSRSGAEPKNAI
jgi:hypothetical protein